MKKRFRLSVSVHLSFDAETLKEAEKQAEEYFLALLKEKSCFSVSAEATNEVGYDNGEAIV